MLEVVNMRYSIHLDSIPPFLFLCRNPSHNELLNQEVQSLLLLEVIKLVPTEFVRKGFYSNWLFKVRSVLGFQSATSKALAIFQSLGLCISLKKPTLTPLKRTDLIGVTLAFLMTRAYQPEKRISTMSV